MQINRGKLLAVGGFLALFIIIYLLNAGEKGIDNSFYIVQVVQSKPEIYERGVVVSDEIESVRAGASGVMVEMIESGTYVSKGQQLFKMDSSEPETWYENAQEAVNTLSNNKLQEQQELSVIQLEERNRKLIKKEDLALAKLELELEEMGPSTSTRRMMDIDLELGMLDKLEAEEELSRQKRLFEKGLASKLDVEEAERKFITREANLEELKIAKILLEKGAEKEVLEEMKTKVEMQEFLVERSNSVSESRVKRIKNSLETIDEQISVQLKDMTISGEQIKGAIAYAPRDGIALNKGYKDWRNAGRWVPNTVGSQRYIGDVIFEVIDPSKMKIETMVSELDYKLVEQDQNVEIFIPALQGKRYTGVLDYIGGIGRDRSDASTLSDDIGKTDITVYNAVIRIDNSDSDLRPGMSAVICFPVTHSLNTIFIPKEYVQHIQGSEYKVLLKSGKSGEELQITGQLKGAEFVSVTDGLSGGEQLIRWPADK